MTEADVTERELTEAVSLTLPNGRFNPGAAGWARQPIVDTRGIGQGRGRNKRWEYWGVLTPTHLIGLTVSHIDYAAVHEVWVLDRATEQTWSQGATVIPARGVQLPAVCEGGPSRGAAKDLAIAIDEVDGGTRLRAIIPGVRLELQVRRPAGHERLAVVVPWSSTRFQYTVKDVARPVTGRLWLDGVEHQVPEGSWAVLDHGRGRWPHDVEWNWGAGSGISGGRVVGLQVGGQWTEGTGSTENSVLIDGQLHKLHGELDWDYDLTHWRKPWRVSGRGLEAEFVPFYNKRSRTDFVVLSSRTDQCFGHWSGQVRLDDGEVVPFSGLAGWAEEVHNRW